MKIIATILVGLMLPFTFAGTAEAKHIDGYLSQNFKCMADGDTRYTFVLKNNTNKDRKYNWSQTRTSDGVAFGYGDINKRWFFTVRVPQGEKLTAYAWTRLNQKTLILEETVFGVCETDHDDE